MLQSFSLPASHPWCDILFWNNFGLSDISLSSKIEGISFEGMMSECLTEICESNDL